MDQLSKTQRDIFRRDGIVRIDDAVGPRLLEDLRRDLEGWIEESRRHEAAFGEMLDGRPRFDVEPGHCADRPALRRVASPTEMSASYLSVLTDSRLASVIAELVGPDIRFHHSKINCKLPGTSTRVRWHQDFCFDPHSNCDMVTALLFLDDVTEANGPLNVVTGSHCGPLYSHWCNGVFTGEVGDPVARECDFRAQTFCGPRGSALLMHTRLLHASGENYSSEPRSLFIFNAGAADAVPLAPCAVPSRHQGMVIQGREPHRLRCSHFEVETPEIPRGASFFVQQAGLDAKRGG